MISATTVTGSATITGSGWSQLVSLVSALSSYDDVPLMLVTMLTNILLKYVRNMSEIDRCY